MENVLTTTGAVVATVAAVPLLLSTFREWSAARRIVSVSGLDTKTYRKYGCVPMQFAGSRFRIVRAAIWVTGFFMVRPRSAKYAFAACGAAGVRDGEQIDYDGIRPRDRLAILLDQGEHPSVFDRSMRRGVASFCRTIAIRDLAEPTHNEVTHCVTVRVRGSLIQASDGSRWLEYEVIGASPRSKRCSGPVPLAEMPDDAIELIIIPADIYEEARGALNQQRAGRMRSRLLRYNPNPRAALVHIGLKVLVPSTFLACLGAAAVGWATTAAIILALVVSAAGMFIVWLCLILMIASIMLVHRQIRRCRPVTENNSRDKSRPTPTTVPLGFAKLQPPRAWSGSTTHTLSVGRQVNANDARSLLSHAWQHSFSHIFCRRRVSVLRTHSDNTASDSI